MDVYIYQAALLCVPCGERIRAELKEDCGCCGGLHAFLGGIDCRGFNREGEPTCESHYDSDDYPKGPFPDGGGEADSPQHCDFCLKFLQNPLTAEGGAYVRAWLESGRGDAAVLREWREFYDIRP